MTSSKEDDPEHKVVTLLQLIKNGLASGCEHETAEERSRRLEGILLRVADVLTLYGANVFTLAVHQVEIIRQLAAVEEHMLAKTVGRVPDLPYFRHRIVMDDTSN